jgi:hypothetical protein
MTHLNLSSADTNCDLDKQTEKSSQLEPIGRKRLQKLIPANTKAVIVAERHKDESDSMTDYFGYSTERTVILGFSPHTKDLFAEMRKYAANFDETAHLAAENRKYEHREKYTGGAGYYLGESNYSGWIVRKSKNHRNRESIINAYAKIAADETNICVNITNGTCSTSLPKTGNFLIVDYSSKAIAVFGDTKQVKERLKSLGGRFNPNLTYESEKKAGWIFSKTKENEVRNLLIKN